MKLRSAYCYMPLNNLVIIIVVKILILIHIIIDLVCEV